ncbi:UNVERIFIED_CONTAM: hypothetical protein Sradi_2062600 [Sesamum radiatum]|uniref:Uncharacterized protein n=1 Tax=Sesamum radiatum TaxID=300843 RepID=A0AAW2TH60_SESRA
MGAGRRNCERLNLCAQGSYAQLHTAKLLCSRAPPWTTGARPLCASMFARKIKPFSGCRYGPFWSCSCAFGGQTRSWARPAWEPLEISSEKERKGMEGARQNKK